MNKSRFGFWVVVVFQFIIASTVFGADETCSLARNKIEVGEPDADSTVVKEAKRIKSASDNYIESIKGLSEEKHKEYKEKITKFTGSCDILAVELASIKVELASTEVEYIKQKNKKYKALTSASQSCLHGLLYALDSEKQEVEKVENCKSFLGEIVSKDIANVSKLSVENEKNIQLVKNDVDPDSPIKNFTPEQLESIQKKGDFSAIASTKPYYGLMELGVSFMPEYDESGNNKGFKESNFFGVLRLNNRMKEFKSADWLVLYQGLEVSFYSAPVACTDKKEGDSGGQDDSTSNAADDEELPDCENLTSVTNLKFRDISNTVNASLYLSALYKDPTMFGDWEFGLSGRRGVLNREKKGTDGDSVAEYYNYGVEARLNDFGTGDGRTTYLNGLPKFIFNYSEGSNDDFAGTGLKTDRKLASFNYRLFDNQPVFIGLIVDGGKGPDTIALNLSYGLKASSIFGLFAD